jgi:hypothetical protein
VSPDAELIVLLAGLHLLGFVFAAVLFVVLMRADTVSPWSPPDDDDDGGGNDRTPSPRPSGPRGGGLPLPDAIPASVRLRSHDRLADGHPPPDRRPAREPAPRPNVPAGDR